MAGEPMDARARAVLLERGYDPSKARSRGIIERDFSGHDLILAMDRSVLGELKRLCPTGHQHKLHLFLDLTPGHKGQDVPDPYFGDLRGFEHVLDLCELGANAIIDSIQAQRAGSIRGETI